MTHQPRLIGWWLLWWLLRPRQRASFRVRDAAAEFLFVVSECVGETDRPRPQKWEDNLWLLGERIAPEA